MQEMGEDPIDRHLVENYHKRTKTDEGSKDKRAPLSQPSNHEDAECSDKSGEQLGLERAMMNMTRSSVSLQRPGPSMKRVSSGTLAIVVMTWSPVHRLSAKAHQM